MESGKEMEDGENDDYVWKRRQSKRTLQRMVKRAGRVPFHPLQEMDGAVGGAEETKEITPKTFQTAFPKQNSLMTTPSDHSQDLIQTTPSDPKHDIFQMTPFNPKQDIFQTTPSNPTQDIFQTTPSNPKYDIFQTTPCNPKQDIFQTMPSNPTQDIFQTTPSNPKQDIFQATPSNPKQNIFQTTPSNPSQDIFQTTPSNTKQDIFQTTPSNPKQDIFQTTPSNPKYDIFQTTPSNPKQDIFQTTPSNPKYDIFQTMPSNPKQDIFQTTPSNTKQDIFQTMPSNTKQDIFQTTPSNTKQDIFQTTPSNTKQDIFQTTPSNTKQDIFQTTPSNPKQDIFRSTVSELKENGHITVNGSKSIDLKSTHSKSKDCASGNNEEFPVYENIFLMGEEKCVEDWPEDSPELCADWKPPGKLRLRRESMKVQSETQKEWGNEDLMESSSEKKNKAKISRRFTLSFPTQRESKSEAELGEKGADLFKGRDGEEDEQDVAEEYKLKQKKGKKFKLTVPQLRDSRRTSSPETPPGATRKNYFLSEVAESEAEKGADLFKGRDGEEDEQDVAEEYKLKQKKGKKFKITVPQLRDSGRSSSPETPPGATCRNYFLSEAAESEAKLGEKGADLFKGRDGEEDEQDVAEEYKLKQKKGKKFKITVPQLRDSGRSSSPETPPGATCRNYCLSEAAESEAKLGEKGADLFKGRDGEEDEQDVTEEYKLKQKKGKKFKLPFPQLRDSRRSSSPETPPGATRKNYFLSESEAEKGADLFKGRDGEEDEQDVAEEYKLKQKKGKKFKLPFPQLRDSRRTSSPETPRGAARKNYFLSEAAEAEWLSAQKDEILLNGKKVEETGEMEDGDTDSLMEWWNTVEQWDELPSDDEELVGDGEQKSLKVLSDKVQKGIHVFNKVFMEQAEGLLRHISELNAVADDILEFHKKAKIASITGGTTSAVGGVVAIAGLALAPPTLGASLVLTAVGIGVATAGGLTSASATISDSVNNSHDRKKVERIVEDYQTKMADINKCLRYVQQGLEKLLAYNLLKLTSVGELEPGVSRAVQMASEASGRSERAVQVSSQVSTVLTGLFHGMDKYYMEKDPKELKKGCKTEFAAQIREVADRLHEALVELNNIREELEDTVYNL